MKFKQHFVLKIKSNKSIQSVQRLPVSLFSILQNLNERITFNLFQIPFYFKIGPTVPKTPVPK